MSSVLILGGTAFVGEAVAKYLIEHGYEVYNNMQMEL